MDEIYNVISYQNLLIYTFYDLNEKKYGQFVISKDSNDIEAIINRLEKLNNQIGFQNLTRDYYALHHIIDCRNLFKDMNALDITEHIYNFLKQVERNEIMPIASKDRYMSQLDLCNFFGFMSGNKNITLTDIKIALGIYDIRHQDIVWQAADSQIVTLQVEGQSSVRALVKLYNIAIGSTKEEKYLGVNQVSARYELCEEFNVPGLNDTPTVFAQRYFSKLHNKNHGIDVATLLTESRKNSSLISLAECIPPYAIFKSDTFNKIVTTMCSTLLTEKSTFNYNTAYNGIILKFGIGGVHGSVRPDCFKSTEDRIIVDIDITSMYAAIATSLKIKPRQTNFAFCDTMKEIFDKRVKALASNKPIDKGKAVILKQVLNYIYGKTKEEGSPYYDPKYSVSVVIAAQLFMAKFLELLRERLNDVRFLMVNTDGVTFIMDANQKDEIYQIFLELRKSVCNLRFKIKTYDEIYIKDVNNYIGKTSQEIVAKGIFDYKIDIYKDNSARVIPIAIKRYLFDNESIDDTLDCATAMDFAIKAKSSDGKLFYESIEKGGLGKSYVCIQNPSRFFYSKDYKTSGKITSKKNGVTTTITDVYPVTLFNTYLSDGFDFNRMYYHTAIEDILSDFTSQSQNLF